MAVVAVPKVGGSGVFPCRPGSPSSPGGLGGPSKAGSRPAAAARLTAHSRRPRSDRRRNHIYAPQKTQISPIGEMTLRQKQATIRGMLPEAYEKWAQAAASAFQGAGAAKGWAVDCARLYVACWAAGLNPRVSSIFRDPARQKALQEQWDSGNRAGLRARPASNSKHTRTGFLGGPASTAMDMPTDNDAAAAKIAAGLGIGHGLAFADPDPGHYFSLSVA